MSIPSAVGVTELEARAADLVPMLRAQAADCERNRRVSDHVIEAMLEADLFRALQPARYGGFELDAGALLTLGSELGRGCGNSAWVFGVLSDHQWLLGLFPDQVQDEIWGQQQSTLVSGSYAPAATATLVDGGYQISGRWTFASGSEHAGWHLIGALLPGSDQAIPSPGLMVVPRADYTIQDTWYQAGLAGTGSNDVVLANVFVPAHRAITYTELNRDPPGARSNDNPLYRLPFATTVTLGTLGPVLGMARGAYETFVENMRQRVSRGGAMRGPSKASDSPVVQTRIAEAAGYLDAARLLVWHDVNDAQATVASGTSLTIEQRIRARRDYAIAVRLCVNALNLMIHTSGASGMSLTNPVQRFWRDITVAANHVGLSLDINGLPFGQHELGLPPTGQF